MIKFNSPEKLNLAKSFLLDVFIKAGAITNTRSISYTEDYYSIIGSRLTSVTNACNNIVNFITRRTFNFTEIQRGAVNFEGLYVGSTCNSETTDYAFPGGKFTPNFVAKSIAWFCQENNIIWDDSPYTADELQDFVNNNPLASLLYEGHCFASQDDLKAKKVKTKTVADDTSSGGSTVSGGISKAKSGYKSAGSQLAYVKGLEDTTKKTFSDYMYCIIGDKAGTITPMAFIHPVENKKVGETAKVGLDDLPYVKLGAGNGYTDLAIYSPDENVMKEILATLDTSKYSNVRVVAVKPASTGYFKIKTSASTGGKSQIVYVKPTKLNEHFFTECLDNEEPPAEDDTVIESWEGGGILDIEDFVKESILHD
jgi:hypothetical protein